MADMREQHCPVDGSGNGEDAELLRQELTKEINRLTHLSSRGLQSLGLFLVISICAWWGFPFLPHPDTVTSLLGKPPSSRMVGTVLLLYSFSALVLSLSRMASATEHRNSFVHVAYLTAFFLFYYFGKTLAENYWAVFGSGITILGVESYRIWSYCAEVITRKKDELEFVSRTGRLPPQEL